LFPGYPSVLDHYFVTALRNFWRFRVTTTVNVVGLALGLVCFIATYVFLDGLLQSDMRYPKANRIYAITQELWTSPTEQMIPAFPQVAPPTAKYLKADFPSLEAVARALPLGGAFAAATDDRKLNLFVAAVDPAFLRIFDLPFVAGNPSAALAAQHSVVLTQSAAVRLFGASSVVGRRVILQNSVEATVTGVLGPLREPSHFGDNERAALRFDALIPMDLVASVQTHTIFGTQTDPEAEAWGNDTFFTYALLPADGSLTPQQFLRGLETFGARHVPNHQLVSVFHAVPISHVALSFLQFAFGGGSLPITVSVFLLDALILAIACLNYANLAVAIATTRAKEIGMRKVLGASRLHLIGQHVIEAALLGLAALLIVVMGIALAIAPLNNSLGIYLTLGAFANPGLWLLVVLLLVGVCVIGGGFPAVVLSRVRPVESLRASSIRVGPRFVPTLLVGIQFAAASFLLVVALVMVNQNQVLQRSGSAYGRDPVVVITNDTAQLRVDLDTLRTELLSDPSIKSVSASIRAPWQSGGWHFMLRRNDASAAGPITTLLDQVAYDFFPTFDIKLLAGRTFDREHGDEYNIDKLYDAVPRTPHVILDRSLASQLGWSNPNDAIGKIIHDWAPGDVPSRALQVIGVVENGYPRLLGPNTDSNLYLLSPDTARVPVIRVARNDIKNGIAHIDAVWERLAPKAPLRRQFTDELFAQSYQTFSSVSNVLAGLAGFAFVIALLGLFGMATHVTSRRRKEIGIRKTLGASAPRVVFMLLRDFARPVVWANIIAWPLAFLAGRVYINLFVERAPLSVWPFLASLVVTVLIAWLSVGGQALRAAGVRPGQVLHSE
jgi:putative ABC transport system permease protein